MPVETVNYITDFNTDWPLGADIRRQGDDHIRNIKRGILGSFSGFVDSSDPNFEAMTMSQAELNSVVDRVLRAGDTMTGALQGHQVSPTADLDFVTKKWVQDLYDGVITGSGTDYAWGITEYFSAAEASIVASSTRSVPHGLSETPTEFIMRMRCISADAGYSVDDVIVVNGAQSNDTDNNLETGGIQVGVNATDVYWTIGPRAYTVTKGSGAFTTLTLSSWVGDLICYVIG